MKNYYVKYWADFANTFSLCHAERGSASAAEAERNGWERISRKEAIRLCVQERNARKADPSFSGYGDTEILPFDATEEEQEGFYTMPAIRSPFVTSDGYIFTRRN